MKLMNNTIIDSIKTFIGLSEMYQATADDMLHRNSPSIFTIDYAYFPLLFLYRHTIELILKANILLSLTNKLQSISSSIINEYLKTNSIDLRIHNIYELLKIYECTDSIIISSRSYSFILNAIVELNRIDPNGQTARYLSNINFSIKKFQLHY